MSKKQLIVFDVILLFLLLLLIFSLNTEFINNFDSYIYSLITKNINPNLTAFFKFITFFGSTIFIVIASIGVFILLFKRGRGEQFLFIIILAMILSSILKLIVHRPRPEVIHFVIENTYSFPSGHTMASFTLLGYIFYLLQIEKGKINYYVKIICQSFLLILALLVIISRIYLGAHYATDTIGAVLLSLLVLINSLYYFKNFKKSLPFLPKWMS